MPKSLEEIVSRYQILSAVIFIFSLWLVYLLRYVLIIVFLAYIFVAAFLPVVRLLKSRGWPGIAAVLVPYIAVLAFIAALFIPIEPLLVSEFRNFIQSFPDYIIELRNVQGRTGLDLAGTLSSFIGDLQGSIFSYAGQFVYALVALITSIVMSIYLLLDWDGVQKWIVSLFPEKNRQKTSQIISQSAARLGGWIRGQLLVCLTVGFLTFIGLLISGIPFSLALGVIAGIFELIPYLGPLISAIPAIIVALNISFGKALIAGLIFILVHQLENHLLIPKVMENAVALHPVAVIAAVLIGFEFLGPVGGLLAIPVLSIIAVAFEEFKK